MPMCNCVPAPNSSPASSVRKILTRLARTPEESLTVLRNGGWEQWIRNLLLVEMQNADTWGFTEGSDKDLKRADLIFRCKANLDVALALELKVNFVNQGTSEFNSQISNAIDQLDGFLAINVPSFITYCLVHLRGQAEAPLVVAQAKSSTSYKHFDPDRHGWPDSISDSLPSAHYAGAVISTADLEVAELRAWVATLARHPRDVNSRTLTFFDNGNRPFQCIWDKFDLLPHQRPKRKKRWEWRLRNGANMSLA